jgi:hypothetical protein
MNKFMLPGVDAKIELLFYNYLVSGGAVIQCWDDSIGTIKMKNFNINPDDFKNSDEFEEVIKSFLFCHLTNIQTILQQKVKRIRVNGINKDVLTLFTNSLSHFLCGSIGKGKYYHLTRVFALVE